MSSVKNLQRLLGDRITGDAAPAGAAVGVSPLTSAKSIPTDRIVADPTQPRRSFDDQELHDLAGSLRDHGQQEPVVVRWDAGLDRYVLIAGERRWRAAQIANLATMSAVVDNRALSPDRILEMQVVENALRADLTPLEAGAAYRSLMQTWGCTQQELAARLHVSQSKVSRALAALELPADIRRDVDAGKVAPVAAVKKAASRSGRRRRSSKPAAVRIDTDAGTVLVTPKPGRSVDDVLAALERRRRGAA